MPPVSRPSIMTGSALLAVLLLGACNPPPPAAQPVDEARLRADSERLARDLVLVDTHVDVPYRLQDHPDEDLSQRTAEGDFDHPRARAGGLDAAFMSIYVPASYQKSEDGGGALADQLIDLVESFAGRWPDRFALARSPADVRANAARGLVSLPMGMENGAPIAGDLARLRHFFDRGVRYVTLTHAENNLICDSSYAKEPTWNGLSPFGREVVAEMNRLGVMVDVSHISDQAFYQVLEITRAPVIASHSSCRHFTPGWQRNMDDDMIRALAANGGVIQINFGSAFLTAAAQQQSDESWQAFGEWAKERGIDPESEEAEAQLDNFWAEYRPAHPQIYADVADVADHIDHVVALVGVDHVGFGSDFDGVGDSLPTGLKDVSQYPNLLFELLRRGYSEEDLAKICGGNVLRVWGQVEEVAARLQQRGE